MLTQLHRASRICSQMFWSVVKPMIPARTLHRIHFYGSDYQEELLKYIAPENLPVRRHQPHRVP